MLPLVPRRLTNGTQGGASKLISINIQDCGGGDRDREYAGLRDAGSGADLWGPSAAGKNQMAQVEPIVDNGARGMRHVHEIWEWASIALRSA
jgi:hypothetical protein